MRGCTRGHGSGIKLLFVTIITFDDFEFILLMPDSFYIIVSVKAIEINTTTGISSLQFRVTWGRGKIPFIIIEAIPVIDYPPS